MILIMPLGVTDPSNSSTTESLCEWIGILFLMLQVLSPLRLDKDCCVLSPCGWFRRCFKPLSEVLVVLRPMAAPPKLAVLMLVLKTLGS